MPEIGDEVKITNDSSNNFVRTGEIVDFSPRRNQLPWQVQFPDGDTMWFHEGEFTVTTPKTAAETVQTPKPGNLYQKGPFYRGGRDVVEIIAVRNCDLDLGKTEVCFWSIKHGFENQFIEQFLCLYQSYTPEWRKDKLYRHKDGSQYRCVYVREDGTGFILNTETQSSVYRTSPEQISNYTEVAE